MRKEEIIQILKKNRDNIQKGNWDAVYDSIDKQERGEFSAFLLENNIDPSTMFKKEIPNNAFFGCLSLTSITIPNSVHSIGDSAFYSCKELTSVNLPQSITSINEHTFAACWSLTSIIIPNIVKSINKGAFLYCSSLISITLPNSITFIGDAAFYGCKELTEIKYDGTKAEWAKVQLGKNIFTGTPLMKKTPDKRITFLK